VKTLHHLKPPFIAGAITLCLAGLTGCTRGWESTTDDNASSSSSSSSSSAFPDPTYYGPGSSWKLVLDDESGDFTFDRSTTPNGTSDWSVLGRYQTLESEFIQLTVESGSLAANRTISGIQISNDLVVLLPFIDNDNALQLLTLAGCPTNETISSNWLLYKTTSPLEDEKHTPYHFGTFYYSRVAEGTQQLQHQYALTDPTPSESPDNGVTLSNGKCTDGLLTSGTHQYYFTQGATALIESAQTEEQIAEGNTNGAQFLLSVEAREIGGVSTLDGNYIGVLQDPQFNGGEQSFPIKGSCAGGVCTLKEVTDLTTGETEQLGYELTFTSTDIIENKPIAGMIMGNITEPGNNPGTAQLACSFNADYAGSGDHALICVGFSPGTTDESTLMNLYMVAKD